MARDRTGLLDPNWEPRTRGGKKKAARIVNEDPKPVVNSLKGDNARVGIPTRQPTAAIASTKDTRVGIPTRQLTQNLAKVKKPNGIQRAISMIASRKTPRTKR